MLSRTLLLLSFVAPTIAFTANNVGKTNFNVVRISSELHAENETTNASSRRAFLGSSSTAAAAAFMSGAIGTLSTPAPASAEVSQGNSLPDGAAQFKRLINLKSDIPLIIKRVTENASEIDKKEWDNLSDFLRRLYKGGEDMKAFTKTSIYDPEKKKKAEECVKFLQKFAQAGDGPVSKQDAEGYATILKKSDDVLETFFDLLRDVPDEL